MMKQTIKTSFGVNHSGFEGVWLHVTNQDGEDPRPQIIPNQGSDALEKPWSEFVSSSIRV